MGGQHIYAARRDGNAIEADGRRRLGFRHLPDPAVDVLPAGSPASARARRVATGSGTGASETGGETR